MSMYSVGGRGNLRPAGMEIVHWGLPLLSVTARGVGKSGNSEASTISYSFPEGLRKAESSPSFPRGFTLAFPPKETR